MTPILAWDQAPRAIAERIATRQGPALVAVGGPVGAGKSTLALLLSECVIRTDDYLPDYHAVPEAERDEPERSHLDELASHLARLRAGLETMVPVWSFQEHRRVGVRLARPAPVIVFEGIHALHESLPADVRVFVEASPGTRWKRWEALEASGARGWGVQAARRYFDKVAEPAFASRAATMRARAHVIVVNDEGEAATSDRYS